MLAIINITILIMEKLHLFEYFRKSSNIDWSQSGWCDWRLHCGKKSWRQHWLCSDRWVGEWHSLFLKKFLTYKFIRILYRSLHHTNASSHCIAVVFWNNRIFCFVRYQLFLNFSVLPRIPSNDIDANCSMLNLFAPSFPYPASPYRLIDISKRHFDI